MGAAQGVSVAKVELSARAGGSFDTPTDTEIGIIRTVFVKNLNSKPIHNLTFKIKIWFDKDKTTYERTVKPESLIDANAATIGFLLPGRASRMITLKAKLPISAWRWDMSGTVECVSCEEFKYGSDLHVPDQLLCFTVLGKTADVISSYRKDPSLLSIRDRNDTPPQFWALLRPDLDVVKALDAMGASVKVTTQAGLNALHMAAQNNAQAVNYVVSKGVKSALTTANKSSAIQSALNQRKYELFPVLQKAGVPLETQDKLGNTPIMNAILTGDLEGFLALKKAGGNLKFFTDQGAGPMGLAAMSYQFDIMEELLKMKVSVNEQDPKTGRTPLMLALGSYSLHTADWLVEHGGNLRTKDKEGHDAIWYAKQNKVYSDLIDWFRRHKIPYPQ